MAYTQFRATARLRALRCALLVGVAPTVLLAAAHGQTTTANAQPTVQLKEITVTVARRVENLQKVSAAIQVVTGTKIASQGLTNIAQIVADVPSVQATTQPAGFSVDIRGQGGDLPSGQSQGSVALEVDGVYNITSIGTVLGFFDLDRLEVLPGPQSTQYGPDADGGVVDVMTKDPVIGDKSGYATLTVGNYDLVRVEAAQNIPLTDVLAARVAGTAIYRGSYTTPASSNNIGQGARVKLLYKPNDDFSAKLQYEIDHVGGTGNGFEVGGPPELGGTVTGYQGGAINSLSNPWNTGTTNTNGVNMSNSQSHLYQNSASLALNYKINNLIEADELAAFTDIVGSGYKCGVDFFEGDFGRIDVPQFCTPNVSEYEGRSVQDDGLGNGVVYPYAPMHSYSSETRLHNVAGSPIDWNLGFYHWSYTFAGHIANEPEKGEGWTRTTTNAFFGQVSYPITDQIHLIAGARESLDQRQRNQDNFSGQSTIAAALLNHGTIVPDATLNLSHFDYTASIEYDPNSISHEYAKVSTGYRPGSLNLNGANVYVVQPNEVNTAFEIGTKNRLLDNTLQLNGDFFYYIQKGYQFGDGYNGFTVQTPQGPLTCQQGPSGNSPYCQLPPLSLNAHDMGLEMQARYNLTANDQISDNFTLMNATFDQNQTTCRSLGLPAALAANGKCYAGYNDQNNQMQFFAISGAQQAHSPHFSTTVSYDHTFEMNSGSLKVGGEVYISSDYYVHPVESSYSWQPAYEQVGLNAAYSPNSPQWNISAYVHNLTNYAVKESALPTTTLGDPRTFGVNFMYKW